MLDRDSQIEFILDHYENPRNKGPMPDADVHLQGGHSGCADVVTIYLKIDEENQKIEKITFEGEGCTISQAAASMMTEEVQGASIADVANLGYDTVSALIGDEMVKTRPRCATLGLDTIKAALQEYRKQKITGEK